jgi:hypothetical protein
MRHNITNLPLLAGTLATPCLRWQLPQVAGDARDFRLQEWQAFYSCGHVLLSLA